MHPEKPKSRTTPHSRRKVNLINKPFQQGRRWIPILLIVVFATLVMMERIPKMGEWFDQAFRTQHWQAKETCKQAALAQTGHPGFARLIKRGRIIQTEKGFYVEDVVLSEMGESGLEVQTAYSCYTDIDGHLVKIGHRTYQDKPKETNIHHQALEYD